MNKKIISAIAVVIIIIMVGAVLYFNSRPEGEIMAQVGEEMTEKGEEMIKEGEEMMEEGKKMVKEGEEMMEEGKKMVKEGEAMMGEENMATTDSYQGQVLSGNKSPLLDFASVDYEKALASDKVIVLYFYANWCPICRAEFPKMESAFNKLNADNVIGFRVNYNDNETDGAEKALASQFGVAYQHTKVILKNGERLLKSPETWSEEKYLQEINAVFAN